MNERECDRKRECIKERESTLTHSGEMSPPQKLSNRVREEPFRRISLIFFILRKVSGASLSPSPSLSFSLSIPDHMVDPWVEAHFIEENQTLRKGKKGREKSVEKERERGKEIKLKIFQLSHVSFTFNSNQFYLSSLSTFLPLPLPLPPSLSPVITLSIKLSLSLFFPISLSLSLFIHTFFLM